MANIDKYGVEFSDDGKTLIDASMAEPLEDYNIPSGVEFIEDEAFRGCEQLRSIIIPEGVKSIGNEAFKGCDSLESVTIPDSLEDIGEDAFLWCDNIKQPLHNVHTFVYMPSSIKGKYAIPDGIEHVWAAFEGCEIQELSIPSSVTDIQYGAFDGCDALEVTIPERFRDEADELGLNDCKKVIYY